MYTPKILKLFSLLLYLLLSHMSYAQEQSIKKGIDNRDSTIALKAAALNKIPLFPGGNDSLFYYINTNLVYPEAAVKLAKEGKVMMSFVVDSKGKIKDINVMNDSGLGVKDQIKKLFSTMPDWRPASSNGIAEDRLCNLVISFHLKYGPGAKIIPDSYTFWRN